MVFPSSVSRREISSSSRAFPLGLRSASAGFKWDQITISSQNAARSIENAFRVFRAEFTIIDRFTSLRWTLSEPIMDLRWSSKRILGVPALSLGIRLASLASIQMSVRWVSNGLLMPVWQYSYVFQMIASRLKTG